jgi:hypothetical protein
MVERIAVMIMTVIARSSERPKELLMSPTADGPASFSHQKTLKPRIGKVTPPRGP